MQTFLETDAAVRNMRLTEADLDAANARHFPPTQRSVASPAAIADELRRARRVDPAYLPPIDGAPDGGHAVSEMVHDDGTPKRLPIPRDGRLLLAAAFIAGWAAVGALAVSLLIKA